MDITINHKLLVDIFSTLDWPYFFSHSLWISHNLILYNRFDKAKSSSSLYQSEDNAIIIKAKIKGMFTTWNSHRFSLCKTSSQNFFPKSILRRQGQSFRIPKKIRITIEFCQWHQMNHHRPCPNNVREKMRKNYRAIRSRYVDGRLVQKILSKDSQQLQITILGYTKFIRLGFYFLRLVTNQ